MGLKSIGLGIGAGPACVGCGKAFLNVRVALRPFCGITIDDGLCGYPKPR
jgi:hypothetical protein